MGNAFYFRLAASNIRKNVQTYFPYILTCICVTAMFYIMDSLSLNAGAGDGTLQMILGLGVYVIAIFAALFLFYTNSFLMKRRKKEFGLLNLLGMEKKHLCRIILIENLYTFLLSMLLGLGVGILLNKLVYLFLLKLLDFPLKFGFFISTQSILNTIALFAIIFLLLLVTSLWQIKISRPIELIRGGQVGEKEPRIQWAWTVLGLLCLGGGYGFSLFAKDPMLVISFFFLAVILVILGTYLLFVTGSTAILKLLRKNKNYYYRANHFISISGLMYRMKQNAAGLATICVLSTMVLVMISSTAALYVGMDDAINAAHPLQFKVELYTDNPQSIAIEEDVIRAINQSASDYQAKPEHLVYYNKFSITTIRNGSVFTQSIDFSFKDIVVLNVISLDDYARLSGNERTLDEGELLLFSNGTAYEEETLSIGNMDFSIANREEEVFDLYQVTGSYNSDKMPEYYIVVKDFVVMDQIKRCFSNDKYAYQIGFDLSTTDKERILAVQDDLINSLNSNEKLQHSFSVLTKASAQEEFLVVYGGLFFLGIFLGIVFILATVLIIYYKQISEGYDDQNRFKIMKKVGLSSTEAKRAINSQILTMFFLPLIVACIHIMVAFPVISLLLSLLNLRNSTLFIASTCFSIAVFAVFYVIVYKLTARVYYKIVNTK